MGSCELLWRSLEMHVWCLMLCLLFMAYSADSQNLNCNSNDLNALRKFSNGLQSGIPGWSGNESSLNCCNWNGVVCGSRSIFGQRVIGLNVTNMNLRGSISNSLAKLDQLKTLDLSMNRLYGVVPLGLFQLPVLQVLNVSINQLSGEIPSNLSLPAIQVFDVSVNSFTGNHPVLAGSNKLTTFDVSGNKFGGPIDASICSSSANLHILRFAMNDLSGEFPKGLKNCSSLVELSLGMNNIRGYLPNELFELSSLQQVYLQGNFFSGNLSPNIIYLSNLAQFDISYNMFSGFVPDAFDKLTKLVSFSVQSNKFIGNLPVSLSSSPSLSFLNLNNNSFTGEISINCSAMVKLNSLDLGSNNFSGPIPDNLSRCLQLKILNLAKNNLIGEIPNTFRNFISLTDLSLSANHFSNISSALKILQYSPNLTSLVLTRNFRDHETMPNDGIHEFRKLEVLVIANCALLGSVPAWLEDLPQLMVLDISWNQLSGSIPSWLGNLDNLFYLDLSNNSLSGELPNGLTEMKSLMDGNKLKQVTSLENFPFFIKRNSTGKGLQYNQVSSFPSSLILSNNMLDGLILPRFGNLVDLLVLDLSWNNFSGAIPDELSGMTNLESLDLSHNNLIGRIPSSLTNLSFLSNFDVSYNNLTGPIPTGNQFSTFSRSDFEGNSDLCGIHLSPCKSKVPPQLSMKQHKKISVLGIIIGIVLGTAALVFFIYLIVLRPRSKRIEENSKVISHADESFGTASSRLVFLFMKDNRELSIAEILMSTNNFDQSYIIGCGGFGLVYKATLPDGRNVAIKRLSGDFCQMEREFQAEVETLSRAQHKNLVLLQGYCKVGSDRLLIYSFMENGSLDYWLHEKTEGASILDWEKRLQIAQGAARGLAYLHQFCNPHILHRDIKSSNILLDENFEAHLADFGLARLICPTDTHVTTDLVGTLGYIPPEYGQSSVATFKGDVYSFGVVLLELLTGRRPVDMCKPKNARQVVSWVFQMRKEKRDAEVIDPCIYDKNHTDEMMRMLEIACLCVNDSPKLRPITHQLVTWLEDINSNSSKENDPVII